MLGIVEHQMGNIRMSSENSIQGLTAGLTWHWKFVANIVHQFVCFVIDLFFGNGQDLTEVALDGRFNRAITLDGLQVSGTQEDQGGSRQDYSQFHRQDQPAACASGLFRFHHPGLLIRAFYSFSWISRYEHSSPRQSRCQTAVKRRKKL